MGNSQSRPSWPVRSPKPGRSSGFITETTVFRSEGPDGTTSTTSIRRTYPERVNKGPLRDRGMSRFMQQLGTVSDFRTDFPTDFPTVSNTQNDERPDVRAHRAVVPNPAPKSEGKSDEKASKSADGDSDGGGTPAAASSISTSASDTSKPVEPAPPRDDSPTRGLRQGDVYHDRADPNGHRPKRIYDPYADFFPYPPPAWALKEESESESKTGDKEKENKQSEGGS